jgi:hypothetical protein
VFYLSIYNQSTLPNMKITPQKWFSTGWAPPVISWFINHYNLR